MKVDPYLEHRFDDGWIHTFRRRGTGRTDNHLVSPEMAKERRGHL
jgi:hypothetical protein